MPTLGFNNSLYAFDHLNGKIGAPLGYSIIGALRKQGNKIYESGSIYTNLQMLAAGRLEGFIGSEGMTRHHLKKHPEELGSIIKTEPAIKLKFDYLLIRRQFYNKYPKLSQQIWDIIAELRV